MTFRYQFLIQGANITKTSASQSRRRISEDVFCDLARVKRSGPFLEDCKFFLSGFSPKDSDKFQLSIETAGGSFSNALTPSVTHMVIRNYVPRHFQLLKDMQISPYKIIPQWLVESMIMGRPIPEEVRITMHEIFSKPFMIPTTQKLEFLFMG